MKQITIVRHAKSDAGEDGRLDVDRHLTQSGIKDMGVVSQWLTRQIKPDLVVSSDAARALHTATLLLRAGIGSFQNLKVEPSIYEAGLKELYRVIHQLPQSVTNVVLVGHNPGFTELVNDLAIDFSIDNLPTAGVVTLSFKVTDWKHINSATGNHLFHFYPKLSKI